MVVHPADHFNQKMSSFYGLNNLSNKIFHWKIIRFFMPLLLNDFQNCISLYLQEIYCISCAVADERK